MPQTYNLTADGSTAAFAVEGLITIAATGTFGSGTLTVELSFDDTTWFAATYESGASAALSADGAVNIYTGPCSMRCTLAGATTPDIDITYVAARHTSKI